MGCWQNAGEGFPILRPARFSVANLQAPLQFRVFDATGENGQTTVATWSYAFVTSCMGSRWQPSRPSDQSGGVNLCHSPVALLANSGTNPFVSRKFVARLDARKTLFLLSKLTDSSGQGVGHHAGSGV